MKGKKICCLATQSHALHIQNVNVEGEEKPLKMQKINEILAYSNQEKK
jgi:hypothetical protein